MLVVLHDVAPLRLKRYGIITKDTVNFCGVAGATALIEACKFVDLECVQYLCSHPHNDVNVGDDSNVTALMEAVNTAADNVGNQGTPYSISTQ